jgi:hypothetical protein
MNKKRLFLAFQLLFQGYLMAQVSSEPTVLQKKSFVILNLDFKTSDTAQKYSTELYLKIANDSLWRGPLKAIEKVNTVANDSKVIKWVYPKEQFFGFHEDSKVTFMAKIRFLGKNNNADSCIDVTFKDIVIKHTYIPITLGNVMIHSPIVSGDKCTFELINTDYTDILQWEISEDEGKNWKNLPGGQAKKYSGIFNPGNYKIRVRYNDDMFAADYSEPTDLIVTPKKGDNFSIPIELKELNNSIYCKIDEHSGFTSQFNGSTSPDIFYRFTSQSCTDSVLIDVCSSIFNIDLYLLDDKNNIINVNPTKNNTKYCAGFSSLIKFKVLPNKVYYIVAELNQQSQEGHFILNMKQIDSPNNIVSILTVGSTTFCEGGSVELRSNYEWGNTWSNGATTPSIVVKTGGVYSVTHTDANGCKATSEPLSVFVHEPLFAPKIEVNGSTTFCEGGSVELRSNYEWGNTWSNGATTPSIVVKTGGVYSVTHTDANGCKATSEPLSVFVHEPPFAPKIEVNGSTTFCEGGSVELKSNYLSGNTWSNGAETASIIVTIGGNYSLMVTDFNGCSAASEVVPIVVKTLLHPKATITTSSNEICYGASSIFKVSSINAGIKPHYDWYLNKKKIKLNSDVFICDTLSNNDLITCQLMSSEFCASPKVVFSNEITMTVHQCGGIASGKGSSTQIKGNYSIEPSSLIEESVTTNDGKTVFSGSLNPDANLGSNGDYFINTTNNTIFGPKTKGTWPRGVNFVGPTKSFIDQDQLKKNYPDSTMEISMVVLNGELDPSEDYGKNGDYYINTETNTLFGPKSGAKWPSGVNLVGPTDAPPITIQRSSKEANLSISNNRTAVIKGKINPMNDSGSAGDYYLNTTTNTLFGPKSSKGWPSGVNLVGPSSDNIDPSIALQGKGQRSTSSRRGSILKGQSNPSNEIGSDGEYYVNVETNTIFGPKNAGIWPSGVNMIGPSESGSNMINGQASINKKNALAMNQTIVLSGLSDPSNRAGENGDYYLNTKTNQLFGPKSSDKWPNGVNMVGPTTSTSLSPVPDSNGIERIASNNSTAIIKGVSIPEKETGSNGDYYLNTQTNTLYGPKSSGIWPVGVNLVGPTFSEVSHSKSAPSANASSLNANQFNSTTWTIWNENYFDYEDNLRKNSVKIDTINFKHRIGEQFGGGIIFHLWLDALGAEHGLIVSTHNQSMGQSWSNIFNESIGDSAQSDNNGLENCNAIISQEGHINSAAKLCLDYDTAGFNDWYLPAIGELSILWNNRAIVNKSLQGIKKSNGLENVAYYWSSTESNLNAAWQIYFYLGESSVSIKNGTYYVRAIRQF